MNQFSKTKSCRIRSSTCSQAARTVDYIEGSNRNQLILFPQSLDEYISEDNPVHFIDAFVESLDLKELGFRHSVLQETGRPPYHPSILLKLYVYGYLNRIQSSCTSGPL